MARTTGEHLDGVMRYIATLDHTDQPATINSSSRTQRTSSAAAGNVCPEGGPDCKHRHMRHPPPSVAAVIGFIDSINRGDIERLHSLMAPNHQLQVLDEPPVSGREANREAWHGYVTAFPNYVIYPDRIVEHDNDVIVLGSTTGSHLGLPDEDERRLGVIWRATVRDGLLTLWQIIEDAPEQRARLGLSPA